MPDAHPVARAFLEAAELFQHDERRTGNVLEFHPGEHLIVSGDLHGHRGNFAKILDYARLAADPSRVLVLQEIIHGGPSDSAGGDRSFELLMRIARLKKQFPRQVHLLLANHDIAQLTGNEITKEGCGVCKAFDVGLRNAFGEAWTEVAEAIDKLILSLPLAGRCPNGVFLSHSLPSPGRLNLFSAEIFSREYRPEDFHRGHSVYELVWGRRHDEPTLKELATSLGASLFILGHQPQESGYALTGQQLIIASDNGQGVIVEFDADEELSPEDLARCIRPIVSL